MSCRRFPEIAGGIGVRDLGGLPVTLPPIQPPGAVTRCRRIYAGGRPERMTAAGLHTLSARLGVGTLIDLRTAPEAVRRPSDPPVPARAWEGLTVLSRPVEDFADADYTAALDHPYLNHPKHYPLLLAHFPQLLREALRTIAEAVGTGPVYVHCSAGRDRTGLIASWLLQLAGVADADVAEEYVRSLAVINEYHRTSGHPIERCLPAAEFAAFAEPRREALLAFLAAHPAAVTMDELGISAAHVAALAVLAP